MKINVLLVGDLRTFTSNYGACATTEMLLEQLKGKDLNLKTIDGRSFWSETPVLGWGESVSSFGNRDQKKVEVKNKIKSLPGVPFALNIKGKFNRNKGYNIFVPHLYEQYKSFGEKVSCGKKMLYEKELLLWADCVVINAEGNIVHGTDYNGYYRLGGLYTLFMAYLSKYIFNKKTYIINHGIDPGNRDIKEIIQNIYPQMDGIYIREKKSINLIKQWGIHNCIFMPDALFLYKSENVEYPKEYLVHRDSNKKLICIGDSSGIKNRYSSVKWDVNRYFKNLINKFQSNGFQVAFIDGFNGTNIDESKAIKNTGAIHLKPSNCNYHQLYHVLAESEIYISGRWHTSILSLVAGTPILLWGSDSHKTEALYEIIDYKYRFFDVSSLPIHIEQIYNEACKIMSNDNEQTFANVKDLEKQATKIFDFLN